MKNIKLLLSFLFISICNIDSQACTNFLVTKGASVDGSNFITYAADSHIRYGELYFTPAADWTPGSMRTEIFPDEHHREAVKTHLIFYYSL